MNKYEPAYNLLLNAKAVYPWNQEIVQTLQKLTANHPELLQQKQAEAQKRRQIAVVPQVIPINADRDQLPEIRIGLAEKITKFYLKPGAKFQLIAGTQNYQGEAQLVLAVKINEKRLEIRDEQDNLLIAGVGNISLSYDNPAATTILFDVQYGQGTFWNGREDRVYRGNFQFIIKENLINCYKPGH